MSHCLRFIYDNIVLLLFRFHICVSIHLLLSFIKTKDSHNPFRSSSPLRTRHETFRQESTFCYILKSPCPTFCVTTLSRIRRVIFRGCDLLNGFREPIIHQFDRNLVLKTKGQFTREKDHTICFHHRELFTPYDTTS